MAEARSTANEGQVADFIKYRQRYLPQQILATRAKLRALENEARRYGLHYLVEESR